MRGRQFSCKCEFCRRFPVEFCGEASPSALQEVDLPGLPLTALLKLLDRLDGGNDFRISITT